MKTLWQFRTARFCVTWDISPSSYPDLSWDDTGEVREKLTSGEWVAFDSQMTVTFDGVEIGTDYLGESIYANPADFRDHFGIRVKSREHGCTYGSYFSDMVREAIREARAHFSKMPRMRIGA